MCHNTDNGPPDLLIGLLRMQNQDNVLNLHVNTLTPRVRQTSVKPQILKIIGAFSFSLLHVIISKKQMTCKGKYQRVPFFYLCLTKLLILSMLVVDSKQKGFFMASSAKKWWLATGAVSAVVAGLIIFCVPECNRAVKDVIRDFDKKDPVANVDNTDKIRQLTDSIVELKQDLRETQEMLDDCRQSAESQKKVESKPPLLLKIHFSIPNNSFASAPNFSAMALILSADGIFSPVSYLL